MHFSQWGWFTVWHPDVKSSYTILLHVPDLWCRQRLPSTSSLMIFFLTLAKQTMQWVHVNYIPLVTVCPRLKYKVPLQVSSQSLPLQVVLSSAQNVELRFTRVPLRTGVCPIRSSKMRSSSISRSWTLDQKFSPKSRCSFQTGFLVSSTASVRIICTIPWQSTAMTSTYRSGSPPKPSEPGRFLPLNICAVSWE